jgi:hypothetical protein
MIMYCLRLRFSKQMREHALRLLGSKAVLKFPAINSLNNELNLTGKGILATLALLYGI